MPTVRQLFVRTNLRCSFFAAELTDDLADSPDLAQDIPIPKGMLLHHPTEHQQLQLELSPSFAPRHRRVWGYIGELRLITSNFTETGAQLQVVLTTPFRYGLEPEETENSWIFARVNCYSSTAAFSNNFRLLKLGDPVTGFLEGAGSSKRRSAQLTGWDTWSAAEWQLMSENTSAQLLS